MSCSKLATIKEDEAPAWTAKSAVCSICWHILTSPFPYAMLCPRKNKFDKKSTSSADETGFSVSSTFENAREIKIWAENNAFHNILLVTSAYHMPRSILVLNYIVPKLKFIAFPVYTERVKLKEWWLWPGTTKLLIHEYFKYIYAHLQIFFLKHLVHI